MGFAFDRACDRYDAEVETVAAELVEQGVAPWPAMERAARIVRQRRKCAAVERQCEALSELVKRLNREGNP